MYASVARRILAGSILGCLPFASLGAGLTNVYCVNPSLSADVASSGFVVLDSPAPAGGLVVSLSSSGGISVPTSVTVGSGKTTKSFHIHTGSQSVGWRTIVATLDGVTRKANLFVGAKGNFEEIQSISSNQALGNADSGIVAPWGDGDGHKVSLDGRYVVFASLASNLVPGDTNHKSDIFLRDRKSGTTTRLSVGPLGAQSDGDSYSPAISGDGQFVAFVSTATNLTSTVSSGTNVYFYAVWNGSVAQVSRGDGPSYQPTISEDGSFIAFASDATNLVSGDINGVTDVFLYDRKKKTTSLISTAFLGADGPSSWPSISGDGREVAFQSEADNLVENDTNGYQDIFLWDTQTSTTTRVSVWGSTADELNGWSYDPSMDGDGGEIAFCSSSIYPGEPPAESGYGRPLVRNMTTSTTIPLSVASLGDAVQTALNDGGRFVGFAVYDYDTDKVSEGHCFDLARQTDSLVDLGSANWSDISFTGDGAFEMFDIRRPVGGSDTNLKMDVALVNLNFQRPISLTLNPSKYIVGSYALGGQDYQATLTAEQPGQPDAFTVNYLNYFATGPTSESLALGSTAQTWTFTASDWNGYNYLGLVVGATLNGNTIQSTGLTVAPYMAIPDSSIIPTSQDYVSGTVAIGFPAPPGGQVVQINTTYPGASPASQMVLIPVGMREATFEIDLPPFAAKSRVKVTVTDFTKSGPNTFDWGFNVLRQD